MKKTMIVVLAGLMVLSAACSNKDAGNTDSATSQIEDTAGSSEDDGAANIADNEITEDDIRSLMTENLNCLYNIFILGTLPSQGDAVEENIYQVDQDSFEDYASFENYVRSIYCEETADMYLNNFPYEGVSKYEDRDGMLYENLAYDGGKGYYVDWSDYTLNIDSVNDTECEFTLTATVEWPGEKPVKEPYIVKGKAVYENGKWLLADLLS